jgi:hypothetical protein
MVGPGLAQFENKKNLLGRCKSDIKIPGFIKMLQKYKKKS